MAPTNKSIEVLQTQVDEVKKSLDELKSKLSVEAKKQKQQETLQKISITKEEINLQIDALKKIGEAKNAAEIQKLQEMIKSLDAQQALASNIILISPIDVPKTGKETMDNTSDLAAITSGIAELNTMVTDLQTIIEIYKGQKATLSDADKTAKKKEIEDKKIAIETKRKEIQTLIDKVKKGRAEVKLDDISDEDVKSLMKVQKEKEEKMLSDDQKQLNDIQTPATTFLESVKNGVDKARGKTKDWVKENPKTAIAIGTVGVGLLVRGLVKLFKKKKNNNEGDGEGKKKEKKKSNFRKWMLGIGVGVGAFFGIKGLLTGKWPRSKEDGTGADATDALNNTQKAAESFEELQKKSPEKAEKLNKVGGNVNGLYNEIYKFNDGTSPIGMGEGELGKGKEKYAGAIPHILENTFSDIDHMEGQRGLFTICAYSDMAEIKKQFAKLIGDGFGSLASTVLGWFGVSGLIDASNVSKKVSEALGGKNTIDDMHMVFRKILKVMSYTNYVENTFLIKEIEKKVTEGKIIYKKNDKTYDPITIPTDAKKKEGLMIDIESNFNEYKIGTEDVSDIRDQFREKSLSEIYNTDVNTKDIFDYNYDLRNNVNLINTKRDETWKALEKDKDGTLDKLSANAEDEIADGFLESIKHLFPFLHLVEMVGNESEIKKTIKEDAGFNKMLADFRNKFTELKSKNDIGEIKKEVDNYYATLKELRTTQNSIVDMTNKDDNFVTTAVTAVKSSFTGIPYCFQHGYKLIKEGSVIKGVTWIYGGVSSVAVLGNITGLSNVGILSPIIKGATSVALAPIKGVWRGVNMVFPKTYAVSNLANAVPAYMLRGYYNSIESLRTGIANGLSVNKAFSIFRKLPAASGQTNKIFISQVLKIEDAAEAARVENIIFGGTDRVTATGKEFLNEIVNKSSAFAKNKTFTITSDLANTLDKYETILGSTAEYQSTISKIASVAKSTENLGDITSLAGGYTNLVTKADDVNSLTYKILQQWGKADGDVAKYLSDAGQIGKAKVYAEKVLDLNKGSVETTKIGESWNSAKNMFKEGMDKVKSLFSKNSTVSPEMKVGLEKSIEQSKAEIDGISGKTLEAASKNPTSEEGKVVANAMKGKIGLRARVLKRSPLLIDGIFNIFNGLGLQKEADEIKKINVERASVRDEKATITLFLGGVELTVFAVGVAMSWNPAGRVILAITAGIETLKYGINKYYEVVETYYRNFEDFKRMYMSHIKQEIISKEAWGDGIDISVQERFQESVSSVFGSACHGDEKKVLSLKTREDAIRALIRMEECENYPYSVLNSDNFIGDEVMRKDIETQKIGMKADSVIRFNYINEKYKDKFVSSDKINTEKGKQELDRVLFESREYLKMTKDTSISAKDIEGYKNEVLKKLKINNGFTKLETLYTNNPLQFHTIVKSLPYFSYLFQQQKPEFYANYDKIKENMDYLVQYYNYRTFGLLPSDIPDITVEADKVDYGMLENFFLTLDCKPTGFTKEGLADAFTNNQINIMTQDMVEMQEGISGNIGQNILYRIAREVLGGYRGKNTLEDLKAFYSPAQKEYNGIYYEDGKWRVNQTSNRYSNASVWPGFDFTLVSTTANIVGFSPADRDKSFATDEGLNDLKNVSALSMFVAKFTQDNKRDGNLINTDTGTAEGKINKEYGKLIGTVITEELSYRKPETVAKYKQEALDYIKANSDGKYIPLSIDILTKLTKAGVENTGYYYYQRDGSKLVALEAVSGAIPTFLMNKKCGLTDNIEAYTVKEVEYAQDIKTQISTIDSLALRLSNLASLDDGDIDLHPDIKKMITAKYLEWSEIKVQMKYMNQEKAQALLKAKYEAFETFFTNTYMMILHCASSGGSNDVDSYNDYLTISNYSAGSLLDFSESTGTMQAKIAIQDFDYIDEFNAAILTYTTPSDGKTVPDLLNAKEPKSIELGKKYANAILQSIIESATLKYDDTGTTPTELCNAGAQSVDKALLTKRLAINTKNVK